MSETYRGAFREAVKKAQADEVNRKIDYPHQLAARDQQNAAEFRREMKADPDRRNDYVRDMVGWSRVHRAMAEQQGKGFVAIAKPNREELQQRRSGAVAHAVQMGYQMQRETMARQQDMRQDQTRGQSQRR